MVTKKNTIIAHSDTNQYYVRKTSFEAVKCATKIRNFRELICSN